MTSADDARELAWPALPLEAWADTCATLHLFTQIAGKIRLALSPPINHCWQVTLYVTARGLTTSPIPHGMRSFQVDFDFVAHEVVVEMPSDGGVAHLASPSPRPVAAFYRRLMEQMDALDLRVGSHSLPNEVPDPIRFDRGRDARLYDRDYANRFWRVLVQADRGSRSFRGALHRQVQPRALLLGRAGPGGDSLLRPPRARAPGRRARPARPRDARRLLARGQQLRLLVRRRPGSPRGVLLVRATRARGLRGRRGRTGRGVLQLATSASSCCRTTPSGCRTLTGRDAARVPAGDVRRRADFRAGWDRASLGGTGLLAGGLTPPQNPLPRWL